MQNFMVGLTVLVCLWGWTPAAESFELHHSRVAHAGGGIDGVAYTNSIEALNQNYAQGFRLFEMDFSWTSDNELVCLHDWGFTFEKRFGFKTKKIPDRSTFEYLVDHFGDYHACTLDELAEWMEEHPDSILITDVHVERKVALQMIRNAIGSGEVRVIPQITQPGEFDSIRKLGFEKIIWTLHSFKGSDDEVVEIARKLPLFAVTMPPSRTGAGLPGNLEQVAIPSYVHTVNDEDEASRYMEDLRLTDIYTDFLPPSDSSKNGTE